MKIRLVCVGKLINPSLRALAEDYGERLRRLGGVEMVELKDGDRSDSSARLAQEAKRIRLAAQPLVESILWDERGEEMGSRISLPQVDAGNDPYLAEVQHFIHCVRHGREPAVSWQDALRSCELAFCAIESIRSGQPVNLA